MRVVAEIKGDSALDPKDFSHLLNTHTIGHTIEAVQSADGARFFRIWIYDEDEIETAQKLFTLYSQHPEKYAHPLVQEVMPTGEKSDNPPMAPAVAKRRPALFGIAGPLSMLVLASVIFIFIWGHIHHELSVPPKITGVVQALRLEGLEQKLLYDYPLYFQMRDELLKSYPEEAIKEGKPPPTEARQLIAEMKKRPFWNGIYERFVTHVKQSSVPLKYEGPLFEKIGQGELWRLFTPALLHFDLLHIFFNVLWFFILANQIEFRIGGLRFLVLLLITTIASNTAQYLMSGSFFMGLSGAVCGMAAFIWARQTVAPWEGYLLQRITLIFLLLFVFGIFGVQLVFFFLELFTQFKLEIPIANTAHILGGLCGYALGRLKYFSLRTRRH